MCETVDSTLPGECVKQLDSTLPGECVKQLDFTLPGECVKQLDFTLPGECVKQFDATLPDECAQVLAEKNRKWQSSELCESRGGRLGLPSLISLRFLWT